MVQYIDKDTLVAEINNRLEELWNSLPNDSDVVKDNYTKEEANVTGKYTALESFMDYINTLEVKEVDLEKSARNYLLHEHLSPLNNILHQVDLKTELQYHKDIETAFKVGFELGLKAQKGE